MINILQQKQQLQNKTDYQKRRSYYFNLYCDEYNKEMLHSPHSISFVEWLRQNKNIEV